MQITGDMTMSFRIVDQFFDRTPVIKAMERAERRVLSRMGAFVRRTARSSIRRRKGVSAEGSPPSAHARASSGPEAGLKFILFGYDAARRTVVVGPVKFNQVNYLGTGERVSVPQLLEFGGTAQIIEKRTKGRGPWRRADLRRKLRPWEESRTRRARYAARPFMRPALAKEKDNFAKLFEGQIDKEASRGMQRLKGDVDASGAAGVVSLVSAG